VSGSSPSRRAIGNFGARLLRLSMAGAGSGPAAEDDATGRKNLLLLVQLRWIAVAGQALTMAAVQAAFGVVLPYGPMLAVLGLLAALNLASLLRLRRPARVGHGELLAVLVFDIIALTVQLYLTGGASNPFVLIYLLQVTLGAVLLEAWSTWAVVGLTGLCFAGLTAFYRPLAMPGPHERHFFSLHIDGMLVCFALDAALLVVFVTRITRNLRARDARLADLRQQAAEEDHIVRMGLLASGAAHELGTPLATLSVILGDWRRMPALAGDPELSQEIGAMEAEVQRCKAIVTGILLSSGQARGEATGVTTVNGFFDGLVADWRAARAPHHLSYENAFGSDIRIVSESTLRQVIFNVLDNALEASPDWVGITVRREGEMVVLSVTDEGPGFPPQMLAQIGKPYQSSKGRRGGGLGLFLVVNVVRKFGGRVMACNRERGGASVTLSLPLAALAIEKGRADAR
jgi:two-component system sensor histidine kinase RegB